MYSFISDRITIDIIIIIIIICYYHAKQKGINALKNKMENNEF